MKAIFNRDALNKSLMFLQTGMPNKAIIPVEAYIKFKVKKEGKCYIYISNTNVEMVSYNAIEAEEDFEFSIPGEKIASVIRNFPAEKVVVTTTMGDEFVKAITISGAGKKRYKINCINPTEFFEWAKPDNQTILGEITFDMGTYNPLIKTACNNISVNETRASMSNILFTSDDNGNLRISGILDARTVIINTNVPFEGRTHISPKIGAYIQTLTESGECNVEVGSSVVTLKFGGNLIRMKAVGYDVFRFESILTREADKYITVDRKELLNSLSRMSTFRGDYNSIVVDINKEEMILESDTMEGNAIEDIAIENPDGVEVKFAINLDNMKMVCSNFDSEKVRISTKGIKEVVCFRSDEKPEEKLWIMAQVYLAKLKEEIEAVQN